MELPKDLCLWLGEAGVLKDRYEETAKSVVLSEIDSERIELGMILQVFPRNLSGLPQENELKTENSTVSRLNNWNLLLKPLEGLGIYINSDLKALIVAGDREKIIEILMRLQRALNVLIKKKLNFASFEGGVLLNNLNTNKPLEDCQSVLEFFVVAICQAFSVNGKVATGLLAQRGIFLAKIIKKGIKNDFTPVLTWYDLIEQNLETLFKLLKDENIFFQGLSLLKLGLGSGSGVIQNRCFGFFSKAFRFDRDSLVNCLTDDSEFNNLLFGLIEKNFDLTKILEFFLGYSDLQSFSSSLSDYCGDDEKYLKIIQKIFPVFCELSLASQVFELGLARSWIELCLQSKVDKGIYLDFLLDIWVYFIEEFEKEEETSKNVLSFIKKLIRDRNRVLKILVIGQIFEILSKFTIKKMECSLVLYKILIFALVEHFQTYKIREFILLNFARYLSENQEIPLNSLIDPLVKKALTLKTLNFQITDFDFYLALGQHPALSITEAILVTDLCGKILMSDSVYVLAAEIPFLIISSRFLKNEVFQDYLVRFTSIIFNIHANKKFHSEKYSGKNSRPVLLLEKILKFGCLGFNEKIRALFSFVQNDLKNVEDKNLRNLFAVLFEDGMSLVPLAEAEKSSYFMFSVYPRAVQEIEKIKTKREMRENNEKIASDKKMVKKIVEKFNLKKEINKRRIELGIKSRFNEDDLVIVDSNYKKNSFDISLINSEFPETQNLIKIVFNKYRRVNKTLFNKYAGLAYKQSGSLTPSFDRIKSKKLTLTQSDFSLLLKDFGLLNNKISVPEMKLIFSELCKKTSKSISKESFNDLLYMVSSFISSKSPAMGKLSGVICLLDFYTYLYNSGGIAKSCFEEPDPGYADRDVIQAINKRLEENPNLPLNENYKKHEATEITVKYQVDFGRTSQKIVIEILDSLFFSNFGFHFLLPTIETSVKIRAKGVTKPENSVLGYLKKEEFDPRIFKLSPHIKNHATFLNNPEDIIMECSSLLDDLLYSIEKNSYELITKAPKPTGSISDKLIREKHRLEKSRFFKKSEIYRKLRHQELSDLVEKHKTEKAHKKMLEFQEKNLEMAEAKIRFKQEKQAKKLKQMEINEKIMKHKLEVLQKTRSNVSPRVLFKDKSDLSVLPLKSLSKDLKKCKRTFCNLKFSSVPRNSSITRLSPL